MIPKVIHYCWFGHNPLPEMAQRCIDSWRKFFPDYEIKEWNEQNFDVFMVPYIAEAYKAKKYAFVSDYARFWIIYKYGGLYFDTDVEVIRAMEDIVTKGAFMGYEDETGGCVSHRSIAPGLGIGAEPGNPFYKEVLDIYSNRHLFSWDGRMMDTVVKITTALMNEKGIRNNANGIDEVEGIALYPEDFFCPKNYYTGVLHITENTRSIHHYSATWVKKETTVFQKINTRLSSISFRLWSAFYFLKKH